MARGYRRPVDVKAEVGKATRALRGGYKQAKSDIFYGVRHAGPIVESVAQTVRGGVEKIKRFTKK